MNAQLEKLICDILILEFADHINEIKATINSEPPTFERWLQHVGGLDFLEDEFHEFRNVDELEDSEAYEDALRFAEEEYEHLFDKFINFSNPETLYRCISAPTI